MTARHPTWPLFPLIMIALVGSGEVAGQEALALADIVADSTAVPVLATTAPGPCATAGVCTAAAVEEPPPFTLRIGARMQVRYSHTFPDEGGDEGAFRVRRARLSASGDAYQHFRYVMQLELAGGPARLIDANVRVPLAPLAEIWIGQGKTPFGRQQLTSSGNLQFVDRSITSDRFTHGRDLGLMLQGEMDRFGYSAGLFNGEGIGIAANPGGRFMPVARAYVTPFGRLPPSETAFDRPSAPRLGLGISLMQNPSGAADHRPDVTRYGVEAAFKFRGLDLLGEYFHEASGPAGSRIDGSGWHAQAGYLLPGGRHSLSGRYAVVEPRGPAGRDESGVGYSYYLRQHRAKVQADLRNIHDRLSDASQQEVRVQLQLAM